MRREDGATGREAAADRLDTATGLPGEPAGDRRPGPATAIPNGPRRDAEEILAAVRRGDDGAAARLLPLVYDELRSLAAARLAGERAGQSLSPTALVHEAYLRLVGDQTFESRGHFFAAAAEAMRRILVEASRRRQTAKRGGGLARHDVHALPIAEPGPDEDLLALDAALDRLAACDPVKARLVQLRYFAGLTIDEAAGALGISPATAKRYWAYSRAWLYRQVTGAPPGENPGAR